MGGAAIWQAQTQCSGAFGHTSIVSNGILFGRTSSSVNLFDTTTGSQKGQIASAAAPAITNTAVIALNAGTLSSMRRSDLVQTWTFNGDGTLATAPLVVNNTVIVGASSGKVYGLDAGTGAQVWLGVAPQGINYDSETGGPMPPSGPSAGENLLIFIAGYNLVAWKFQ